MSSLSRFRDRNKQRIVANKKLNSKFIFNGYPSIEIFGQNGAHAQAAVVNQQEKDKAYIFTNLDTPLTLGSVWTAKDLHFLISEKITVIKDVEWNKYIALLCNLNIDGIWGYFKGPEKSFINVDLKQNVLLNSNQKPVLVLPEGTLDFQDKIVIKARAWMVQEYDAISTPGIAYYSLIPSTVKRETVEQNIGKEVYIEKKENTLIHINTDTIEDPTTNKTIIGSNINITVETENGYFKPSNSNIKIKKHTENTVVFSVPFGIKEFEIEIKKKGEYVRKAYIVN